MCLFRLFNELSKTFVVIAPYVHDIANLAARYEGKRGLQIMAEKIQDIVDLVVYNYNTDFQKQFSILAHGTSCQLAVYVSNQLKCSRMTLLNPLGVILPKMERQKVHSST